MTGTRGELTEVHQREQEGGITTALTTWDTDTYHHTFFKILGNWSFRGYFKKEAIEMVWVCLTEEFKLDPERLYASYFWGNEIIPCNNEAKKL